MRTRTKKQLMDREKTMALLQRAQIGHLATVDQDGATLCCPSAICSFRRCDLPSWRSRGREI